MLLSTTFTTETTSKFDILGCDFFSFPVLGTQIGFLEHFHKERFTRLSKSIHANALISQFSLKISGELLHKFDEGLLAQYRYCRVLISTDLSYRKRSRLKPVPFWPGPLLVSFSLCLHLNFQLSCRHLDCQRFHWCFSSDTHATSDHTTSGVLLDTSHAAAWCREMLSQFYVFFRIGKEGDWAEKWMLRIYQFHCMYVLSHFFSDAHYFSHMCAAVGKLRFFYETEKAVTLSRIKILLSKLPTDNLVFRGGERRRREEKTQQQHFRRSLSPTNSTTTITLSKVAALIFFRSLDTCWFVW